MRQVVIVLDLRPAGQFVVDQAGIGREDRAQPGAMGAQAEVQVVVDDTMRFVEAAQPVEDLPPHQHAGAGDRDYVALGQRQAEIARLVLGIEPKRVPAQAIASKEHAGVLHLAVGIQQLRPGDADPRLLRMFQQRIQPVVLHDFDVIVQEQQEPPIRGLGRFVIELRPVERVGNIDDFVGMPLHPGLPRLHLRGDVVHYDDFVIAVRRLLPQGVDAGLDIAVCGAGWNDDRDLARPADRMLHPPRSRKRCRQHGRGQTAPARRRLQRRLLRHGVVQHSGTALAQQFGHVADRPRRFGAAQQQVVFAIAHQAARRDTGGRQHRGRGNPGPADIIG